MLPVNSHPSAYILPSVRMWPSGYIPPCDLLFIRLHKPSCQPLTSHPSGHISPPVHMWPPILPVKYTLLPMSDLLHPIHQVTYPRPIPHVCLWPTIHQVIYSPLSTFDLPSGQITATDYKFPPVHIWPLINQGTYSLLSASVLSLGDLPFIKLHTPSCPPLTSHSSGYTLPPVHLWPPIH